MIINEQLFALEDQCDRLVEAVLGSQSMKSYHFSREQMRQSSQVKQLAEEFAQAKRNFEAIESFGTYAPDYKKKNLELRQKKRSLDLNDTVSAFRVSETNLQNLLDEICSSIATAVSDEIKIDAGNPFFETGTNSGCRGNCHAS